MVHQIEDSVLLAERFGIESVGGTGASFGRADFASNLYQGDPTKPSFWQFDLHENLNRGRTGIPC